MLGTDDLEGWSTERATSELLGPIPDIQTHSVVLMSCWESAMRTWASVDGVLTEGPVALLACSGAVLSSATSCESGVERMEGGSIAKRGTCHKRIAGAARVHPTPPSAPSPEPSLRSIAYHTTHCETNAAIFIAQTRRLSMARTRTPADAPASAQVFWVVVLGDFGRSPRMQYHTLSLSRKPGTQVYVLAYPGSQPLADLVSAPNVHMATVKEPPAWLRKLPRVLALLLKVILQLMQLIWLMLVSLPRPSAILLQNPPAIPTLFMCWLAARRHAARLVIDWHNYGYTILALTQGQGHWLVRLAKSHERKWGRGGDAHFCVTKAMKEDLQVCARLTYTRTHRHRHTHTHRDRQTYLQI